MDAIEKINTIKILISSIGAFLSAKLGILYIMIPLLMVVMIVDYLTGMLSAKKERKTNSKTGMWGIIKKLLYGVEIAVAMIVDWTIINLANGLGISIKVTTFFGLLVTIWLVINEIVSILENLTRLDVPLPSFLVKVVSNFKIVIESNGEKMVEAMKMEDKGQP
ncbi:phage holin family protein [Clostridium sp. SHJSY1]|uniref:phage holin family protein n=1 Tax=Clostridium sp. SHJSY1 TaxID=2942483 RepID=UPI002875C821|nr:phage holin family protein [Clostridium sp. SHJSY1]MDS0524999.1 phage holin family protein [Clostridium sp. SHJSY1]